MRLRCHVQLVVGVLFAAALPAAEISNCQTLPLQFGQAEAGWAHVPLSRLKTDTVYETITEADAAVLKATADGAASAYVRMLPAPMQVPAKVSWQWRTAQLVANADNRDPDREDAPVRVLYGFDGDKSQLSEEEQRRFNMAKRLSDRDMPYAMLMYVWTDAVPVDTVIPSAHSGQIKMIVAASGPAGLGNWQVISRDLKADYERAFGAPPGPLLAVGVMTDTDNTDGYAEGFYRDLSWQCGGQ